LRLAAHLGYLSVRFLSIIGQFLDFVAVLGKPSLGQLSASVSKSACNSVTKPSAAMDTRASTMASSN